MERHIPGSIIRGPASVNPQNPAERISLPKGGHFYPTRPSPDAFTYEDLGAVSSRALAFGAASGSDYTYAQHALLVSILFDDTRLALAGLLFSFPEAIYGRMPGAILSQMPPGTLEVLGRYEAGLRRSLYIMAGLGGLKRCELDLVAERDAEAWQAAYWRVVLQGKAPASLPFRDVERLDLCHGRVRARGRALLDAIGAYAVASRHEEVDADAIAELVNFDSMDAQELASMVVERAHFLIRQIGIQHRMEMFEPELVARIGRDEIEGDWEAYREETPDEFKEGSILAGPPSVPSDFEERTTWPKVDWNALRVAHPEYAEEIERLVAAERELDEQQQHLVLSRLRAMKQRAQQAEEQQ